MQECLRISRKAAGKNDDVFEEHLQHIAEQLARNLRRSVIIDEPALTGEQTRQARAAAAQAAHVLAQRAIRAAGQFAVLSDLANALLHSQEQVRQQAADMLAAQAALTGPPPYALASTRRRARPISPTSCRRARACLRNSSPSRT